MYSLHWRKEQQDRRRIVLDGIENYNKENDTQAKFGESKKKKKNTQTYINLFYRAIINALQLRECRPKIRLTRNLTFKSKLEYS